MLKYGISPVYAGSFIVSGVSVVIQVRCTKLYHYLHQGFFVNPSCKTVLVAIPANPRFEANFCFTSSRTNEFGEVAVCDEYNPATFLRNTVGRQ